MLLHHVTHLSNLIGLRVNSVALQIDFLMNAVLPKNVVASSDPLLKPQIQKQATQGIKANTDIRSSTENLPDKLSTPPHWLLVQSGERTEVERRETTSRSTTRS